MSAVSTPPTAVVHIDAAGVPHYAVTGGARLLVIDERTPGDRVYEISTALTWAGLYRLIGGSAIGHVGDGKVAGDNAPPAGLRS
ncbi:MAG: hypothetical protein AB7O45_13100 [Alphaproteobacteria bacterium]